MKRLFTKISLFSLVGMLALAACNGGGGSGANTTPTNTLAPLFTLTPILTATPISTRTPYPTFTPIPSESPIPPTPSDTPMPSPTPAIVGIVQSLQSVNMREGPGTSFGAIRALIPGTGVMILGRNTEGNWLNVEMEDGVQGWVSATLVFVENTPTPFPTLTLTPDLTALALGTPLPTALLGGGTVTPTPPRSIVSPTPIGTQAAEETDELNSIAVGTESFLPVIDINTINQTATALAAGVVIISPPAPIVTGQSPNSLPSATFTPLALTPFATVQGGATATITSTVSAAPSGDASVQQGVDVFAMCDNPAFGRSAPTNLAVGSTIDVFWAWFVSDTSFMDQHVAAVNYEVRVNDTLLSNWREFGQRTVTSGDGYAKYWYVPFGPLAAGQYRVTYRATWSVQVSDGYDNFGPGTNNAIEEGTCTFTVR